MRWLLMIISFILALNFNVCAQNDTIILESVEISASYINSNLKDRAMERKIDTAIMKRLQTVSLSQLLIQHSPVFIKTYGPGGTSSASFRGTTASHTLVLWNGLQINSPFLGEVDFSTIPVFFTDEVSLQWGSKTSANSGGLGGVVNVANRQKFSAENDYRRQVFTAVSQFNNQRQQCMVSRRAMNIAKERYELTMHRFKEGNATVTDLNMAQTENDSAFRQYISDVSNFWAFYYQLRQCTLYDFIKGEDLEIDVNEMI